MQGRFIPVFIDHPGGLSVAADDLVAFHIVGRRTQIDDHPAAGLTEILRNDLIALLSCILCLVLHVKCVPETFQQGGLPGASSSDHRIQVTGEAGRESIEVSAFDAHSVDAAVEAFLHLVDLPYPRFRVLERQQEGGKTRSGHLDERR